VVNIFAVIGLIALLNVIKHASTLKKRRYSLKTINNSILKGVCN
jgi:hypothetical protein